MEHQLDKIPKMNATTVANTTETDLGDEDPKIKIGLDQDRPKIKIDPRSILGSTKIKIDPRSRSNLFGTPEIMHVHISV
jgi:hypothetical protein